jgi:tRNA pseudouridine55 synthase
MDGILLIDKPAGLSSADVVRQIKRRAGVKVGHLGTLDPFATGVLPLCLGEATKIAQFLNAADKRYEGVIRLGWATDTGDRTGSHGPTVPVPDLAGVDLEAVARRFAGEQLQTPPMYSALKRDGVPLYRLARQGIQVERRARPVRIDHLRLTPAGPARLHFEVSCSKGTYIRVLGEEIGAALGSAAHLEALRRTGFGSFDIADAATLDGWSPDETAGFVTLRHALAHLPAVTLDAKGAEAARQGKIWVLRTVTPGTGKMAVLLDPNGAVVAVLIRKEPDWAYGRVLSGQPALHESPHVLVATVK